MVSKFSQQVTLPFRATSVLAALCTAILLLVMPSTAFAGDGVTTSGEHPPVNLCVTGSVIDWTEQILPPGNGWSAITATAYPSLANVNIPTNADHTFAVSLPSPAGTTHWEFMISLQPGWEGVTPTTFTVPIDVSDPGCKAIRWKIRKHVKVNVLKIDQHHTPLKDWTITARPGKDNVFGKPVSVKTNANGIAMFHLTPGVWIFSEGAPAGVHYDPITPVSGEQTVNVQMPGPIEIRFKNRIKEKSCIDVYKRDATGTGLVGWKFDLLYANGAVAASGETNAFGQLRFDGLPFGPYKVVEKSQPGWTPITSTSVDVTVDGVGCEQVWFENKQYHGYCIEGYKVDKNGDVGLPGWIISAKPKTAGGYTPANVTTNGIGYYRFDLPYNDYRIPGETYTICETVQDGWDVHGEQCHEIKLPKEPGYCVEVPKFINKQTQYETVDEADDAGYVVVDHKDHHASSHNKTGHDNASHNSGDCTKHHVVKHGEALYSIGAKHGKSAQQMLDANPWVREQPHFYVYVGQKLCIP